jgi:hypothetical protein
MGTKHKATADIVVRRLGWCFLLWGERYWVVRQAQARPPFDLEVAHYGELPIHHEGLSPMRHHIFNFVVCVYVMMYDLCLHIPVMLSLKAEMFLFCDVSSACMWLHQVNPFVDSASWAEESLWLVALCCWQCRISAGA